jgi:hypothetical protein
MECFNAVRRPQILVYQKRITRDQERSNLESNFKVRDQLSGVELAPLPCFYMESIKLLGLKQKLHLSVFMCKHKLLSPVYRDLYPEVFLKSNLLNDEESALSKRAVRPERKLCMSKSMAMKRILIGTTLLPKPIVEYILEQVFIDDLDKHFRKYQSFRECLENGVMPVLPRNVQEA